MMFACAGCKNTSDVIVTMLTMLRGMILSSTTQTSMYNKKHTELSRRQITHRTGFRCLCNWRRWRLPQRGWCSPDSMALRSRNRMRRRRCRAKRNRCLWKRASFSRSAACPLLRECGLCPSTASPLPYCFSRTSSLCAGHRAFSSPHYASA